MPLPTEAISCVFSRCATFPLCDPFRSFVAEELTHLKNDLFCDILEGKTRRKEVDWDRDRGEESSGSQDERERNIARQILILFDVLFNFRRQTRKKYGNDEKAIPMENENKDQVFFVDCWGGALISSVFLGEFQCFNSLFQMFNSHGFYQHLFSEFEVSSFESSNPLVSSESSPPPPCSPQTPPWRAKLFSYLIAAFLLAPPGRLRFLDLFFKVGFFPKSRLKSDFFESKCFSPVSDRKWVPRLELTRSRLENNQTALQLEGLEEDQERTIIENSKILGRPLQNLCFSDEEVDKYSKKQETIRTELGEVRPFHLHVNYAGKGSILVKSVSLKEALWLQEIVYLHDRGVSLPFSESSLDLCFRAFLPSIPLLAYLLKSGENPNPQRAGMSYLYIAILSNCYQAALILLEAGSDPNSGLLDISDQGLEEPSLQLFEPCSFQACRAASSELLKLLLSFRASPSYARRDGVTPLHIASSFLSPPLVRLLLEAGADPFPRDEDGDLPEMYLPGDDRVKEMEIRELLQEARKKSESVGIDKS